MAQPVVGQHAGDHRLADRHGADADAGVVAPLGPDVRASPVRVTLARGVRIEEVGLTAKRQTTGWPVEMPPRTPPAWFDRNGRRALVAGAHLVGVLLAAQRRGRKPSPISTPLTALIDISAAARSASSLP